MNATLHHFRHYFGRFRWEVIFFWIVSGALSVALWNDAGRSITSRLALVEMLSLVFVVVRIVAAEVAFGTTAGWWLRPLPGRVLVNSRVWLMAVVVVPAILLRSGVWWVQAGPSFSVAGAVWWRDLLPLAGFLWAAAMAVRYGKLLLSREERGLLFLFFGPLAMLGGIWWMAGLSLGMGEGSRVSGADSLPKSVVEQMPRGAHAIVPVASGQGEATEFVLRRRVERGASRVGRLEVEVGDVRVTGGSVCARMFVSAPHRLPPRDEMVWVMSFGDGSFSGPEAVEGLDRWNRLWLYERYEREISLTFPTPLGFPWSRMKEGQLLDGAELMVFRKTGERFFPGRQRRDFNGDGTATAGLELAHMQPSGLSWRSEARGIGREEVRGLFKWPTWSDAAWKHLVVPGLSAVDPGGVEIALLDRFATDPRVASFMQGGGWRYVVMPGLERRLAEGRPVPEEALSVMLQDPGFRWSGDFERALTKLPRWGAPMLSLLESRGGEAFDRLAAAGWKEHGGAAGRYPAMKKLAELAAQRGDVDALRYLARENEAERLAKLVAEAPGRDPALWLGRHAGALRYDGRTKRYVTDAGEGR